MSKNNNPYQNNNDDDDEEQSEEDLAELLKRGLPIIHLEGFILQLRRDAIKLFNLRFEPDKLKLDPKNINPKAKRWTNTLLDHIITEDEIFEILERSLAWSDEFDTFLLTDIGLNLAYDNLLRNIFFKIGQSLVEVGVFELRYDNTLGPNGDFTFVLSKKAAANIKKEVKKSNKQKASTVKDNVTIKKDTSKKISKEDTSKSTFINKKDMTDPFNLTKKEIAGINKRLKEKGQPVLKPNEIELINRNLKKKDKKK